MKACKRCKVELPMAAFGELKGRRERRDVCSARRRPLRAKCAAKGKTIWEPSPKAKDPAKLCERREKKKKKSAGLKKK